MFTRPWVLMSCLSMCLLCSCSATELAGTSHPVKELAADGAWTWFNDERVIIDDDMLIIGSVDSKGVSRTDCYDLKTGLRKAYPLSTWESKDDHNNPALLTIGNGKILACYSQHGKQKQWYWRIADIIKEDKQSPLKWGPEQTFTAPAKTTYCNLVRLADENGRIYNFSRNVGWNPNIQYSDDMGQTWNGPILMIKSGDRNTRPYVKYADNGKNRIDILYTDGHPRNEPTNNVYHMYYKNGSFYKSDGTLIKTMEQVKEDPMVPADGTLIYDGSTDGRGWVWDVEYDQNGDPVGVFINSADHARGNDLRYRYARWDAKNKQWHQQQIAFAGTHLYMPENHYAGGIAIDPDDTNIVYISCDVDPTTGQANETGRYQIYQGQTPDNGESWKWKQLTFDTQVDNLRPVVPRHHGQKICVIWFQGEYKTYTNYQTRIVGIIEP